MITPDWFNDIRFAFSRRVDGHMSFKRASAAEVIHNRENFLSDRNLELHQIVAPELTHGAGVAVVDQADAGRGAADTNWIPDTDGLVTNDPQVLLLTTHADCAPIVIYDPQSRILGQAHAGWRGLSKGVIQSLVDSLLSLNGTDPTSLHAWIGPTVRPCCYVVGDGVAGRFPRDCIRLIGKTLRLDLVEYIKMELERLLFLPENVTDSRICTSCDTEFSSLRRDGLETAAMIMVTGLNHLDTQSKP